MAAERDVELRYDPLTELHSRRRPDNPKAHDQGAIVASVDRVGYITPVVVNDEDGQLLEGHGRVEALVALKARGEASPLGIRVTDEGEWLVPTLHGVRLGPADAKAFVVAANRTTELGGWDERRLAATLVELAELDGGLSGVGYDATDLDRLVSQLLQEVDRQATGPDEAPPPNEKELYVRSGDIYSLGRHLVLCGDSRKTPDVQRVFGTTRAACLLTDPPYGVAYEGGTRSRLTIQGDDVGGWPN